MIEYCKAHPHEITHAIGLDAQGGPRRRDFADTRKMTASQRLAASCSARSQRCPAAMPRSGSRSGSPQLWRSARALLGFPENRSLAFWTKVECHSSAAICSTGVSFGDALSEPDSLARIECLNTESASRTALAFEAVAHGDAGGIASHYYLELSATACSFAIRHVDYLSTETHS